MESETLRLGPTYTVSHEGSKYVCYSSSADSAEGEVYNVCVSNAADVWSTRFTSETLSEHKCRHEISSLEGYNARLREAFEHRSASLTFQDNRITLKIGEDAKKLTFNLYKLPLSDARFELQLLLFGLADRVCSLGKQLQAAEGAAACSPEKSQQRTQRLFMQEIESRKVVRNAGGSAAAGKKRIPGESLINPGSKRKQASTGVDFEDA